jgi:ribonuclease-3
MNVEIEHDLSKPHVSREEIQSILGGMKPRNLEYYRRALVHRSMQKCVKQSLRDGKTVLDYFKESNERLEFLGDAVFALIVADYIFEKYPTKDEGFLTRMRTKIVRDVNCVRFAKHIEIDKHVLVASNKQKGTTNDKIMEDAFEAFIGALYSDTDFKFCKGFIVKLIEKYVNFEEILEDDNYKDVLMRYTQGKQISLPIYKVIKEEGPPHKKIFTVCVYFVISDKETEMGKGTGCSKKIAEQEAALNTLKMIEDSDLEEFSSRDK